jgi:hypothetical protein
MSNPKILIRGKITYYIYNEKIIVGVGGGQYISYNQYDNWNRKGISQFRRVLLKSKETEYANAIDQITLAVQCEIKGASTRKPEALVCV